MSIDLNEIAVFVKVVQTGGFSAAARALAMPNSTVSSKVSALEKRLGLTLIQRTTRRLSVTAAGRAYFDRCVRALGELEAADDEALAGQGEPRGLLRVTAPVELGNAIFPAVLPEFLAAHPKVNVEVLLNDRRVDLVAENIDLALRAGELKDSSLIAKRVGQVEFGLFLGANLLARREPPRAPQDLGDFEGIRFNRLDPGPWQLIGPNGEATIDVPSRLSLNDLNLIKTLVSRGVGVALLPTFFCAPEVRDGQIIRVLPEWATRSNPVQFVYPAQRFVPSALSAFISFALDRLRPLLAGK